MITTITEKRPEKTHQAPPAQAPPVQKPPVQAPPAPLIVKKKAESIVVEKRPLVATAVNMVSPVNNTESSPRERIEINFPTSV